MTEDRLKVRAAGADDRQDLVTMVQGLNRFERVISSDRAIDSISAERHFEYLEQRVLKSDGFILLAVKSGKKLGCLIATLEMENGHYVVPAQRPYGYVANLFVHDTARGQNVGRTLLDDAATRFRGKGLKQMRLAVLAGNNKAIAMYDRLGFSEHEKLLTKPL